MKIEFSNENKAKNDYDYPRLMLEVGERARIVCIEGAPTAGYVHTLKAPQIVNGEMVMHSVRQKDGSYKDEIKMDFIGRHLCFGNPNTLSKAGKDPEGCPTCAKANENDHVASATRAFAMHVIRYKIQPGAFKPQTPFQVDLVAWRFTDKIFNTLVDIAEEHGDLRKKDLNLGPCINKNYQNYEIQVGSDAVWLSSETTKELVKQVYAENKSEDLIPLIARKISRDMAAEDVEKVLHRWAVGEGRVSDSSGGDSGVGIGLDELLDTSKSEPTPEASAPAAAPVDFNLDVPDSSPVTVPTDDLDVSSDSEPTPPAAEGVSSEPKDEPKKDYDFDSLLDGL